MKTALQTLAIVVVAISVFAAGAYWGAYQFAKVFSGLNVNSYFEKTYAEQLMMMGVLREIDSGKVDFARSTLKSLEDAMIISINAQRDYFDPESFNGACSVMVDIYAYRQEHQALYDQDPRAGPNNSGISDILSEWSALDCAAGLQH